MWGGLIILLCLLAVAGAGWFWGRATVRAFAYPAPPAMPPVVAQTMDELLAQLETVLQERSPSTARSLQPGLSDAQIAALENKGGFQLSPELHRLYAWRNGMPRTETRDFIPGHRFLPLEEAVEQRAAFRDQIRSGTVVQRVAHALFTSHRTSWLTILDDDFGDGYFYDPERGEGAGAFFKHFAEDGFYRYFPSLRNFLAGVIECFETGAYEPNGDQLEEDYLRAEEIWSRYGATPDR